MLLDMTLNIEITAHRSFDLLRKIFQLPRKRSFDIIFKSSFLRNQSKIKSEKESSRACLDFWRFENISKCR